MTDATIEATMGPLAAQVPPEEWPLARLRWWLARPSWSGSPSAEGNVPWAEAVALLAGVDPEESAAWGARGYHQAAGLYFLPGALSFYGHDAMPQDSAGLDNLAAGVRAQVAALLGLHLDTCPPRDAVRRAQDAKVTIPWREAALADPECCRLLPDEVLGEMNADSAARPVGMQTRGGQARGMADDRTREIRGAGRAAYVKLRDAPPEPFHGKLLPGGVVNVSEVARVVGAAINAAGRLTAPISPSALRANTARWLKEDGFI